MCKVVLNSELNGVEMYFEGKPVQTVIDSLKDLKFRWNKIKKCWYAKQSIETIAEAQKYSDSEIHTEEVKTVKQNKTNKIDLWSLTTYTEVKREKSYNVKEITKSIRAELKARFSFVKFSITNPYSDRISIDIKSAPFEKESIYIKAIQEYCKKVVESHNFCTSDDPYGDYGSSYNLYFFGADLLDYTQTEANETIIEAMKDFDVKKVEQFEIDKAKEKADFEVSQAQRDEEHKQYLIRQEEEKKEIKNVNNNIEVVEIEEEKQYFVINSKFANLNKNCTLSQYEEEVLKGACYNQTVKITREVHFNNAESLENFNNLLLVDFEFITGTSGSYTDDNRINSMTDYDNMTELERKTVKFNSQGIAVYLNDKIQFVIDAQGYSYARYVGLIDENTTITKKVEYKQLLTPEEVQERTEVAEKVIELNNVVIENNNIEKEKIYLTDNWNVFRKEISQSIRDNKIKLNKDIIQQIKDNEYIKTSMYRLIRECEPTQEQFINVDIQEGEKLTIIRPSMIGGASATHITFKEWKQEEYAQYTDNIKVIYESKNKLYGTNLENTKLLIYKGWFELPQAVLFEATDGGSITKFGSYDEKALEDILTYFEKNNILPVINTYRPIF
jgi:hypothetical protein